jgi:hypothetical protein
MPWKFSGQKRRIDFNLTFYTNSSYFGALLNLRQFGRNMEPYNIIGSGYSGTRFPQKHTSFTWKEGRFLMSPSL